MSGQLPPASRTRGQTAPRVPTEREGRSACLRPGAPSESLERSVLSHPLWRVEDPVLCVSSSVLKSGPLPDAPHEGRFVLSFRTSGDVGTRLVVRSWRSWRKPAGPGSRPRRRHSSSSSSSGARGPRGSRTRTDRCRRRPGCRASVMGPDDHDQLRGRDQSVASTERTRRRAEQRASGTPPARSASGVATTVGEDNARGNGAHSRDGETPLRVLPRRSCVFARCC